MHSGEPRPHRFLPPSPMTVGTSPRAQGKMLSLLVEAWFPLTLVCGDGTTSAPEVMYKPPPTALTVFTAGARPGRPGRSCP